MKTHIKILGIIYLGIGVLIGLTTLLFIAYAIFGKNASSNGFMVIGIFVGLFFWFFQTGLGLWSLHPGARINALLVAIILMFVLNGALLLADGGKFSSSTGQTIFHLACMAIGLYTIVILLLPGARAVFQK
jgi:hypothetical protein